MIYALCVLETYECDYQTASPLRFVWVPLSSLVKAQVRGDLPYKLCSDPQGSLPFLAGHQPLCPAIPLFIPLSWPIRLSASCPGEGGAPHGTTTALPQGVTFHQAAHYSSVPGFEHFNEDLPCVQVRGRLDKSTCKFRLPFS